MTTHSNSPSYPFLLNPNYMSARTEHVLAGPWKHASNVIPELIAIGWMPEKNTNTMYGTGVYLSDVHWGMGTQDYLEGLICHIRSEELDCYLDLRGDCSGPEYFKKYLHGLGYGATPESGSSPRNRAIRDHHLKIGKKAVLFCEGGDMYYHLKNSRAPYCLVAYDPSILVVEKIYKEEAPAARLRPNDVCSCGSSKKYKRCCGR